MAGLHVIYSEVEQHPAWLDFTARIVHMRDNYVRELLDGTLDKFGNSRDDEKRAVIVALERILAFPRALHAQYDDLHKRKLDQEEKAKRRDNIHGRDVMIGPRAEV